MSLNAKKHIVVLSDSEWEKYTKPIDGHIFIGTIQRSSVVGALSIKDGRHYCVINGNCEPLNERKITLGIDHAKSV